MLKHVVFVHTVPKAEKTCMYIQLLCAADFDFGSENYILNLFSTQVIRKKVDFAIVC